VGSPLSSDLLIVPHIAATFVVEAIEWGFDGIELLDRVECLVGQDVTFEIAPGSLSLSSGAYLGSHSTVSQARLSRAVRLALLIWIGAAAVDDQLAGGMVERADQRQLARLPGRRHSQIRAALHPGVRQIGMVSASDSL
jgi:hypothetical protein